MVNHKDENPKNNSVDNLEWCTNKYNLYYSFYRRHGRYPNPRKGNGGTRERKIVGESVVTGEIIKFPSISSCTRSGFSRACVKDCLSGRQKTHKGYVWKYAE